MSLRHITIITNDGLTLYHRSFIANDMDDVLFSALSGAIISFSKEMGDELLSINMKKQNIYFTQLSEGILILSIAPNMEKEQVHEIINQLKKSKNLDLISKSVDTGFSSRIKQRFDMEIANLFNISKLPNRVLDFDEDDIAGEAFLMALEELEKI